MTHIHTNNFYFIPFKQDEPLKKPKSLVYDYTKRHLRVEGFKRKPIYDVYALKNNL